MFEITADKTILLTRGDVAVLEIGAKTIGNDEHMFKVGDIIRFRVYEKNRHDMVVLLKEVTVESEAASVDISLESRDTKIGELINKPKDYWYEVELNPDTAPQTLIGYDTVGPKIFRLFPEGADANESVS